MKKGIIIGLVFALLIGGIFWRQRYVRQGEILSASTGDILTIGSILPLTGDLAYVGQEMQRGMELAIEENKNSGIKIIYEDDESLSTIASVNALNKLVNIDKVDVVLDSAVNAAKALAPTLNNKRIPGLVVWDSNETIAGLGDYVFGMGYSTEGAGQDMANLAYNDLGLRHVSVITAFDEWSEIISSAFMEKFIDLGGTIDYQEKIDLEENDVRANIAKIQSKKSEAIYFPTFLQSLHSIAKQSRELGFKGYLLTGDTLSDADIQALGQSAEGIYAALPYVSDDGFSAKYKSKYGKDVPATQLAFAALGYDSVNFVLAIKQSLEKDKLPVTGENIQSRIVGFEFKGIAGTTIFSSKRITNKRETIMQVKNGQYVKP